MKTILWVLVIWIVVSIIHGSIKQGTAWMDPFKRRIKDHPLITVIIVILALMILF